MVFVEERQIFPSVSVLLKHAYQPSFSTLRHLQRPFDTYFSARSLVFFFFLRLCPADSFFLTLFSLSTFEFSFRSLLLSSLMIFFYIFIFSYLFTHIFYYFFLPIYFLSFLLSSPLYPISLLLSLSLLSYLCPPPVGESEIYSLGFLEERASVSPREM